MRNLAVGLRWAILGALIGGLLIGQIAFAAIGDGGVIFGCVANKSGALRVVDGAVLCKASEKRISWNTRQVIRIANVASDGSLVSGTASFSDKQGDGTYRVAFGLGPGIDLSACAPVATAGGDVILFREIVTVVPVSQPWTVWVYMMDPDPNAVTNDSPFHLAVTCPGGFDPLPAP